MSAEQPARVDGSTDMTRSTTHNAAEHRFELFRDGELAGYAEYAERGRVRNFHHTLTFPRFRGHGVAAEVVRAALDDSRDGGFTVVPSCWYVEKFIAEHPGYRDLLGN